MPQGAPSTAIPGGRLVSRIRKGGTVFEEGDASLGVYEIECGWVRLLILTEEGQRQILSFLTAGDSFGFNRGVYSFSAEAVTDLKLTRRQVRTFNGPSRSFETGQQDVEEMTKRYDELAQHTHQLLHRPVEQRVLCFLAWLAHRQGPEPTSGLSLIPMSRQDIADYLGVAAATLSRTMTQLQNERRIVLRGPRRFAMTAPPHYGTRCRAADSICGACRPARLS